MEYRFLVLELPNDDLDSFKVVGRYRTLKSAFSVRDILKEQSPINSFKVSCLLDD